MDEMKKNQYLRIGVIAVMVALVALCGILGYVLYSQRSEVAEMEEVMAFEKEELEEEYQQLAIQYEGYEGMDVRSDSLADLLAQEQQRVQDLMEELRITKATDARRISELKKELATLREVMRSYVIQIDSLNRTNARLTAENQQYRQDYNRVSTEAQDLRRERTELKAVVTRASMLEISSFDCTTLNKHDRKTRIHSHIVKLQLDYTLAKNVTCSRGLKTIYIRVVNPQGDLVCPGTPATFPFENTNLEYSVSHEVEYEGEPLADTQYLPMKGEVAKGLYNADFFVDGQMIASFPFEIK